MRSSAQLHPRKMQREEERSVKQSNLDLQSDLSLSVLASSHDHSSGSYYSGEGNRNAAVLDPRPNKTTVKGGVSTRAVRPPPPPVSSSSSTSNVLGDSCSSDTDQESASGGGTDRECRKTEACSGEEGVELQQVYVELLVIRDKMKDELQTLVAKEDRVQQIVADITAREEEIIGREAEIKEREAEIREREAEMKEREAEIREREAEMNQRDEEMQAQWEEMKVRDEKISRREEEVKQRELELKAKEEDMKTREEKLKRKEELMKMEEEKMKSREEDLMQKEQLFREREAEIASREEEVCSSEEGLRSREVRVVEMERLACEAHESLMECIEREVEGKVGEMDEGRREEVGRLGREVRERNRELKRLRECYNSVKKTNENLKKELKEAEEKSTKLQTQLSVSHSRLTALQQRKREEREGTSVQQQVEGQRQLLAQVEALKQQLIGSHQTENIKRKTDTTFATEGVCYEVLGGVMSWLSRAHLSQPLTPTQETSVQQSISKLLPSLVTLLPPLSHHHQQLPALEFLHWCLTHLSHDKKLKFSLTSTLRRIGDCVYKPMVTEERSEKASDFLINSSNTHIRMLSCLVVLQTTTQVDILAKIFEQLYHDLKENQKARELFLLYCGVDCILPYMRASCRLLCSHTVNIYLLLSMESGEISQWWVRGLGTGQWFSACATLLRETHHTATLEKISIILQRLSKIRGMRGLFESGRVAVAVQEILRQRQTDTDSAFICLNLQSTLTNLK